MDIFPNWKKRNYQPSFPEVRHYLCENIGQWNLLLYKSGEYPGSYTPEEVEVYTLEKIDSMLHSDLFLIFA